MKLYSYTRAVSAAIQFISPANGQDSKLAYGSLFSESPMGYNFEISITASADKKNEIVKICNELHDKYDHCLINELKEFSKATPTFERIALDLFESANTKLNDPLLKVLLKVDNQNWVEVRAKKSVQVTKSYKINCVHRHHNPDLSMVENQELYGKCSAIHGHEYTVEVSLGGVLNCAGQIINHDNLDKIIDTNLVKPFHKTYLNDQMGNTSGELISELFYKSLSKALPANLQFNLTLRETRKNSFVKLA